MKKIDTTRVLLAFAGMVLIAGANAVAVRFTIRELAPFWSAALRFIAAATVFFVIMTILKVPFSKGKGLAGDVVYGLLSFGMSYALFYWGVQEVPAGVAQVIFAFSPLFTVFLAALHGLEGITSRRVIGALLAAGGFMVVSGDQLSANVPIPRMMALLLAAATAAEAMVLVKWFPRTNPVAKNAIGMTSGAAFLLTLALITGEPIVLPRETTTWFALAYLVVLGTVLVFTFFLYVLNRWTASASSYQFVLLPFVTVIYGYLLLDERITAIFAVGAALVIAGVYIGAVKGSPD